MPLARLAVAGLMAGAVVAFVIALLRPRPPAIAGRRSTGTEPDLVATTTRPPRSLQVDLTGAEKAAMSEVKFR